MSIKHPHLRAIHVNLLLWTAAAVPVGCQPAHYRHEADKVAGKIVERKQEQAVGRTEPFSIEPPAESLRRRLLAMQGLPRSARASLGADRLEPIAHWPEKGYPLATAGESGPATQPADTRPVRLTLVQALQVAARNNRRYQGFKEAIFRAALDLDLERDAFRNTFFGAWETEYQGDLRGERTEAEFRHTGAAEWTRQFKNGTVLSGRILVDMVQLLTQGETFSRSLYADASISIPLLRGAGEHIVTEPLTQADRNVLYAMHDFYRFKRRLAVDVASAYLGVLQQFDEIENTAENYRGLIANRRRARRLADASRLPEIQIDQAKQDELRARSRWIAARRSAARQLDNLKLTLGLPTDARIELDETELKRLADAVRRRVPSLADVSRSPASQPAASQPAALPADAPVVLPAPGWGAGGPLEMAPTRAIERALGCRLDLRTALGEVYDAQRQVVVAADALRAGLTLTGAGSLGERRGFGDSGLENTRKLRPEKGVYTAGLLLDLPLERTAERNAYRDSYIALNQAVRAVQELEDEIKLDVRDLLRELTDARENIRIQAEAVRLARRRVRSTELYLEAGRAEIRDVLEAQEDLVGAQNALSQALVRYRVAELALQRDMGVLEIDEKGLWSEYQPEAKR